MWKFSSLRATHFMHEFSQTLTGRQCFRQVTCTGSPKSWLLCLALLLFAKHIISLNLTFFTWMCWPSWPLQGPPGFMWEGKGWVVQRRKKKQSGNVIMDTSPQTSVCLPARTRCRISLWFLLWLGCPPLCWGQGPAWLGVLSILHLWRISPTMWKAW